jgi:hypothetical protein
MKYLYTAILILSSCLVASAQNFTIKGALYDTMNARPLNLGAVTLIRASDSVLETFTRTHSDGSFELHPKKEGKYIIIATFPSFVDYVDVITVKNKKTVDLGTLPMVSKSHLLQEFVLTKQYAAIKIKGDTTEYMADSFKVKEGATVEDLLKHLPGIQVDKNGQITAQGETVQKILVDGEEFFSDDPAVVTKGLQANAVEKVQVFDKKSDQTEFTGIDDGQKIKTINLELKEDKKKGYFGKVDVGGGTDGYFQDQAMLNAFKGKRQFSIFGIMSNTDKVGLGWADNDKFNGGNNNTIITDEGSIVTFFTSNDDNDFTGWDGKYNGQGFPKVWTGGAHFADKWNDDAEHTTANYRYAKQRVDIDGTTITQYPLGDNTSYITNQHKYQYSNTQRNSADALYEWKVDTSFSIKLTADAGVKNTQTFSAYKSSSYAQSDAFHLSDTINTNNRQISSNADADFINADLLLKKKLKKKGRTISLDLKENYKESKTDGHLYSDTYFDAAHTDSVFDQRKQINAKTLAFAGKATYTEPLSKVAYLELNYGMTLNNSNSLNYSYDKPIGDTRYDSLDNTYSSNYKYNVLTNSGGLAARFVYKKVNFSFGSDVSNAHYNQQDLLNNVANRDYSYLNLFPKANFTYRPDKTTSLTFNYSGYTTQPTIDQIQPLKQNTDPTNIIIGNPNLKQQFTNNAYLRYNSFKILTSTYTYASLNFTQVNNAIVTAQDTLGGIRTSQYVNVDGNYSGYGYFGYGAKVKNIDMRIGGNANISMMHVNNFIDGIKNTSNNNGYTLGLDVYYYKDSLFDLGFTPHVTYNDNHSTITTFSSSYWSGDIEFEGTVQLPLKFEIHTNFDWFLRQTTPVFTQNNSIFRWDAYVGKKFLKGGQLELRAAVNDILNQNIGYSRSAQAGVITQSTYNTIRRYGMLSLVWNFTHTPAGTPDAGNGGMMMKR